MASIMASFQWFTIYLLCLIPGSLGVDPTNDEECDKLLSDEPLRYGILLHQDYKLNWDFDDKYITFQVIANTTGWVGLGVSPNGKMYPSDVIVGWVNNAGEGFLHDRHTVGHRKPVADTTSDWIFLDWSEVDGRTTILVKRKFDTCDEPHDIKISNGTTRVIWSFQQNDPMNDNIDLMRGHGRHHMGTKSLLLLDPPPRDRGPLEEITENYFTIDMRMNYYKVPTARTTYACTMVQLPDWIDEQHHMIRWEAVIDKGHEWLVHHTLIYFCVGEIAQKFINESHICYWNVPDGVQGCAKDIFIVWAVGGTAFNYPKHVGHSMGGPHDKRYFKIETHYDNSLAKSGIIDNSGFRLYLTKDLRQHSAGLLEYGVRIDLNQVIPPKDTKMLNRGICPKECVDEYMDHTGIDEIHVFGGLLHSHLIGSSITARLFRNGEELAPVLEDKNYDFDYQESRFLVEERIVKKGDMVVTDCLYDSSKRTNVTYGGLDTSLEMCLAYFMYYPLMNISACLPSIQYDDNQKFKNKNAYNWDDPKVREAFVTEQLTTRVENWCYGLEVLTYNGTITDPIDLNNYKQYKQPQCPKN